jgi:germination protein M
MKKNKKKIIAIITLIVIILVAYFIFRNVSIEKEESKVDDYQDYTPQEEISDEQLRQTKITLYFANNETGELETEIKVVNANTLLENPCKEIMQLLLKGPQSTTLKKIIPEGTVLYDVTLENNCAIINVSNEFLNFENEEMKLKIINSIVNTLTNLKEVESVKFMINGEQNEKLADTYIKNK